MPSALPSPTSGGRIASQRAGEMHVSGQGKKIRDIDLNAVLRGGEDSEALALVRSLDLSYNIITVIRGLDCLSSLTSLDLAHNHIATIHSLPPTITRLNLSHNDLTSEAISQSGLLLRLPLLRELDISHNKISSLSRLLPPDDHHNQHAGVSPCNVQYLRADSNRVASLEGIHLLGASLRILSLEGNYISSLSDIRKLRACLLLQAASFERCPVTEANRYREAVVESCPSLATLDGTPLPSAPSRHGGDMSVMGDFERTTATNGTSNSTPLSAAAQRMNTHQRHRGGAGYARGSPHHQRDEVGLLNDESQFLQNDGALRHSASKVNSLNKLNKELRLTVQQQTESNTFLERENAQLKQQLSEARRVIASQLDKMAVLESQRDGARGEASAYATQLSRAGAQLDHSRHHADSERRKRQEEQEKLRVRGLFQEQLNSYMSGSRNSNSRPQSAAPLGPRRTVSRPPSSVPNQPSRLMKRPTTTASAASRSSRLSSAATTSVTGKRWGSTDTAPGDRFETAADGGEAVPAGVLVERDDEEDAMAALILSQRASLRHNSSTTFSDNTTASSATSPSIVGRHISSISGANLANQLKRWVRQEVDEQVATTTQH